MDGGQWHRRKPYSNALAVLERTVGTSQESVGSSNSFFARIFDLLTRPGGLDGTSGRGMTINEVLALTPAQTMWLVRRMVGKGRDGLESKMAIDERWKLDAEFREKYAAMVARELKKSKDSLLP